MKDINVMLDLLKKMSETPIGAIPIRQSLGMDTGAPTAGNAASGSR